MKRIFSILLSMAIILSGTINLVFADSIVTDNSSEANLLISSDEGIEKLLNSDRNMISTLKREKAVTDISFSIGKEKKGKAEMTMEGTFEYNGIDCQVEAEGEAKSYSSKIVGKLILGHLKGKIYIDEIEREINVKYEESKNSLYYSITINNIASEEGFAVISFGESNMDENVLKELGFIKEEIEFTEDEDQIEITEDDEPISPLDYNPIRGRWIPIDYYGGLITYGKIYLDDQIVYNYDDGKLMFKVQVDKDEAEELLEDETGDNILAITVDEFMVDIVSEDEESYFTALRPATSETRSEVFRFILGVMDSIPHMPSAVINAIEYVGSSIGNDIRVTHDDMYRVRWRIEPGDDRYMDWSVYRDGGYPVEVGVQLIPAKYDEISVKYWTDLVVYLGGQSKQSYIIGSETGYVSADLADYK